MDRRFLNLFALSEAEAITLLDTPIEQLEEDDSRYVAASHLAAFDSEASIQALMRAVENTHDSLQNRITRRKAVESLGKLKAQEALAVIRPCLADADRYTVEVAAWAIGEIGTTDVTLLEAIAQGLERPDQTYRVMIQTLAKANYLPALERIRPFMQSTDEATASAAIATVCRFSQDYSAMTQVVAFLQSSNVNTRRGCLQDLIDANYYPAMGDIARCPISLAFRLRALRQMARNGLGSGEIAIATITPWIEQVLSDHPKDLNLVHAYDQPPSLAFLIRELYQTDFGRCYLAIKTLLEQYPSEAPAALFETYQSEANNDYGAHYHVVKLFGWLKHHEAYELLLEALHNPQPQFQKSRAAAALALAELGDPKAIAPLKAIVQTTLDSPIWDLKYATLMALETLGDPSAHPLLATDPDPLIRAKATMNLTLA
jgi:bilin biosynthesis protein